MKKIKKIAAVVCLAASLITVQHCMTVKAAGNYKNYDWSYNVGGNGNSRDLDYTQAYQKYVSGPVYFRVTSFSTNFNKSADVLRTLVVRGDKVDKVGGSTKSINEANRYDLPNNVIAAGGSGVAIRVKLWSRDWRIYTWGASGLWSPDDDLNAW